MVLFDLIIWLGCVYNNVLLVLGWILFGGVDFMVLYLFKCFLGVVCNIEEGGLLIIIVIVMVEIGFIGDMVIFEEFKGIGNVEFKLDCKIVEWWVFFVVDVNFFGICKDELLLLFDEFVIVYKLCCVLLGLDFY